MQETHPSRRHEARRGAANDEPRPAARSHRRPARSRALLVVGVCLLLALAACSSEEPSDDEGTTKVRLAYIPSTPWLAAMVAEKEGIFEKHGLDVEVTQVQTAPTAAIGQQFDIGQATGPDLLQGTQGGLDQVAISNISVELPTTSMLMVAADSDIDSPADLEGHRVAITNRTSVMAQSVLFMVESGGGDADAVTLQEMPFPTMSDQLSAGRVDAIAVVQPFVGQAEAAGAKSLLDPIYAAGREVAEGVDPTVVFATTTRDWAEKNPEAVHAWRDSLAEAIKFIETNEPEARAILSEAIGLPAEIADAVPLPGYASGPTQPQDLQTWIDVLEGSGALAADNGLDPTTLVIE